METTTTGTRLCQNCKRAYPAHCVNELAMCAICAYAAINRDRGLPHGTLPPQGTKARRLYLAAQEWIRK